jgi:ribonuclease HII
MCGSVDFDVLATKIVAKVTRDSIMQEYAQLYPEYGFERHKGYGTADHMRTLIRLGPLPLHRWSFAPVWRAGTSEPQLALWKTAGAPDPSGSETYKPSTDCGAIY